MGGKESGIIHYEQHSYFQKQNKYMETRQNLILWNSNCSFHVLDEIKNKIHRSFIEFTS